MRPKEIVYFEWIIFATLALGVLQTYLGWDQMMAQLAATGRGVGFVIVTDIFVFGLIITLTLLISRRKSQVAKWISVGLFVLGLPGLFFIISRGMLAGSGYITLVQTIAQLIAYGLLFTPAARDWFRNRTPTSDLSETFS